MLRFSTKTFRQPCEKCETQVESYMCFCPQCGQKNPHRHADDIPVHLVGSRVQIISGSCDGRSHLQDFTRYPNTNFCYNCGLQLKEQSAA